VSKRHQSNRRKAYGRRQHEVLERRQRDDAPAMLELALDDRPSEGAADGFAFLESRRLRLHYAMGD